MPNAAEVARVLNRFMDWTNANSDGWPYWSKPSQAARRAQALLTELDRAQRQGRLTSGDDTVEDFTKAEKTAAIRPIKTFLTRQGANWEEVLG